jgi:hypothetical protein
MSNKKAVKEREVKHRKKKEKLGKQRKDETAWSLRADLLGPRLIWLSSARGRRP